VDRQVARSRDTGGVPADEADRPEDERTEADAESTTGTDENALFVGRVAGDDVGYTDETGAEARAERESS
jgi:hypothetical protein